MIAHLVEDGVRRWGRFEQRPDHVNPLDQYAGTQRLRQRLRLKEWLGWTVLHPELSSSMIIQDAHYLASSEIYVRDAASGVLTQHARNARGGSPALPAALYGSSPSFRGPGYEIDYSFGPVGGEHRIRVAVDAHGSEPALRFDLTLDGSRATPPLSVSAPLPGGAMYTHKLAFPAAGTVRVGERAYDVEPSRDLVILDEHKTFLPYRTRWLWGTFAAQQDGAIVGANLAQRPTTPGSEEESCLWLPGAVQPLSAVTFAPSSTDPLAPWRVRSADGRLDVTFAPDGRKDVKHQLVLFSIDYWQLVGTYAGTVAGREVSAARGVLESMRARL